VTIFAGLFGLIGYEVGHTAGEGDAFIQAYNYIQDMQHQH